MAQFTQRKAKAPVGVTKTVAPRFTHESGSGFTKDTKTELYTLALVERFGGTFYESASDRLDRLVNLSFACAKSDPVWTAGFARWLRNEANTRSASLIVACAYAAAYTGMEANPSVRSVVDSVCQRADEPTELVACYLALFGRALPRGVKTGVSDAVRRLWTEYNVLKYNRTNGNVTMRDVLNLAHVSGGENPVFKYIIDSAYGNDVVLSELPMASARQRLMEVPEPARRAFAANNPTALNDAGFTWENISSWLPGGMDAQAWELAIPQMGYMARLRNLRNFEKAGVSKETLRKVRDYIADPAQVERSRQLPYRFWSAYRFTDSDFFTSALAEAFDHSMRNVPALKGKTLIMVDTSASMQGEWHGSTASKIPPVEQAAVLACGANAAWDAEVWQYADRAAKVNFTNKYSGLRNAQHIQSLIGNVGHGTATWPSTESALRTGHFDRVIILTDMQDHPGGRLPKFKGNIFVWDLQGYSAANIDTGSGRYLMGGFDDNAFSMIEQIEAGRDARWPWIS